MAEFWGKHATNLLDCFVILKFDQLGEFKNHHTRGRIRMTQRIFIAEDFAHTSDGEPIRSLVTQSADAAIIMWLVLPGQSIPVHHHPEGQDSWMVLSGRGRYLPGGEPIAAGQIVVAHREQLHGVENTGTEPLRIVSVVAPAEAGYVRR